MNFALPTMTDQSTTGFDPTDEFKQGVKLLKNGYPKKALVHFQRALESQKQNPYYLSFLGLSLAHAERKWDQASELCETALQLRRKEMQFHLNLADVYAAAGRREKALDTLDIALELFGKEERLMRARSHVLKRRSRLLPFLDREHFLNRELGKLRHHAMKRLAKEKS